MTSLLDHSLTRNRPGYWQYGRKSRNTGDGRIVAFNGEAAEGALDGDEKCVRGPILLRPAPGKPPMTRSGGCPAGWSSYDEHPGYDYVANYGTEVRAAGGGRIIDAGGNPCVLTNITSCASMGYVGIDHGNGYITQYGHLSRTCVSAGQRVERGQILGLSGETGVPHNPHLHFEVLKQVAGEYYVVDPYGWVGTPGGDPLYSAQAIRPANLWTHETPNDSAAPRCRTP